MMNTSKPCIREKISTGIKRLNENTLKKILESGFRLSIIEETIPKSKSVTRIAKLVGQIPAP